MHLEAMTPTVICELIGAVELNNMEICCFIYVFSTLVFGLSASHLQNSKS